MKEVLTQIVARIGKFDLTTEALDKPGRSSFAIAQVRREPAPGDDARAVPGPGAQQRPEHAEPAARVRLLA